MVNKGWKKKTLTIEIHETDWKRLSHICQTKDITFSTALKPVIRNFVMANKKFINVPCRQGNHK
jgi:hypothetical protein